MKSLYKYLLACMVLLLSMSSCREDYELPPTGGLDGAELLIAGSYEGEWTIAYNDKVETHKGKVTFGPAVYTDDEGEEYTEHNANSVEITSESGNLRLKAVSSVCNTTLHSSGKLNVWNLTASNPFGTTFTGNVSPEGNAYLYYEVGVISGKGSANQIKYKFSFNGNKVSE